MAAKFGAGGLARGAAIFAESVKSAIVSTINCKISGPSRLSQLSRLSWGAAGPDPPSTRAGAQDDGSSETPSNYLLHLSRRRKEKDPPLPMEEDLVRVEEDAILLPKEEHLLVQEESLQ